MAWAIGRTHREAPEIDGVVVVVADDGSAPAPVGAVVRARAVAALGPDLRAAAIGPDLRAAAIGGTP